MYCFLRRSKTIICNLSDVAPKILQDRDQPYDKRQSQGIQQDRFTLVMLFVRAFYLNTPFFPFVLFRIVITELILEFFGFGPVPEHWFNHKKKPPWSYNGYQQ